MFTLQKKMEVRVMFDGLAGFRAPWMDRHWGKEGINILRALRTGDGKSVGNGIEETYRRVVGVMDPDADIIGTTGTRQAMDAFTVWLQSMQGIRSQVSGIIQGR